MGEAIAGFSGEYRWLSNFWPVKVARDDGICYPSAEHAYVAAKTTDMQIRRQVAALPTAGQAKRFGRTMTLRPDWEQVKDLEMLSILRIKFAHPHLASRLKETEGRVLIEENTWGDTYWGVCRGVGRNMLGNTLMLIRSERP